jgi:hypothetical protein
VVLETLGQAYWIHGDKDNAVHSIEQALALIEPVTAGNQPSRVRENYEKTLKDYQSEKLVNGCPVRPSKP